METVPYKKEPDPINMGALTETQKKDYLETLKRVAEDEQYYLEGDITVSGLIKALEAVKEHEGDLPIMVPETYDGAAPMPLGQVLTLTDHANRTLFLYPVQ